MVRLPSSQQAHLGLHKHHL